MTPIRTSIDRRLGDNPERGESDLRHQGRRRGVEGPVRSSDTLDPKCTQTLLHLIDERRSDSNASTVQVDADVVQEAAPAWLMQRLPFTLLDLEDQIATRTAIGVHGHKSGHRGPCQPPLKEAREFTAIGMDPEDVRTR